MVPFCVSGCHQASDVLFLRVLDFYLFFLLLHYIPNYFETIAQSDAFSWTPHALVVSHSFYQCLTPQLPLQESKKLQLKMHQNVFVHLQLPQVAFLIYVITLCKSPIPFEAYRMLIYLTLVAGNYRQ